MNSVHTNNVESILSTPVVDVAGEEQEQQVLREKAAQFIRMRWVAIAAELLFIYLALGPVSVLPDVVTAPLLTIVAAQLVFNAGAYAVHSLGTMDVRHQLLLQVTGDVVILTGLLHFSGGVENPFVFLYLIHVTLAAMLFETRGAVAVASGSLLLVGALAIGQYSGVIPHYDLMIYRHEGAVNPARNPYYVGGMLLTLTVLIGFITFFSTMLMRQIRESRAEALEHARENEQARRRFETVLTASGAGVLLFDRDQTLIWANDRIQEWFPEANFTPGERCPHLHEEQCTLFQSDPEQVPDLQAEAGCQRCAALQSLREERETEWERVHVTPEGNKRYFQFITNPIRDEEGEVQQIVELVHDLTDQKRMEKQIEHQERMSSLGRLASGIMHEIGNPLSSISARLRRLREKTEEEFTTETVEFLDKQINRLNRLIHDISSFAQAPEPTWEPCRIDHLIDDVKTLLELDQNSKNVEIDTYFQDNPSFLASEDQLSQVFLNLGLNALEAMPDGGTLEITSWQEEGRVYVSFSDTGEGIPPEEQEDIFTPYYSSAEHEDGTGLGLSIVHSFIQAHGGDVEVSSVPGEGATFTVWIPYHDPDAQSSNESTRSQTTGSRT